LIVSTGKLFRAKGEQKMAAQRIQSPPHLKKQISLQASAWFDRIHPFLPPDIYN
jgi:hypothetical protein